MKTAAEIRQDFIDYFQKIEHKIVKSVPVIPVGDPSLLFTNAGMNQFKPIFLNQEKPQHLRVADCQKCIRVSGKHNDLEGVGKDGYHHTFFEMLGNWSFGDYYKREAIRYAWDLITKVWKFPKERLWATIYQKDDEAFDCWQSETDIAPSRILHFGKKDNFWEMGDTGPCGPCSEIHYYTGNNPGHQDAAKINAGDPEYVELWNLVFIQYDRDQDGNLEPLPKKHVDTGAGLERIVAALQKKYSNYETDLFLPIIQEIAKISKVEYHNASGTPHRVIADHIRMLTFAIADGGMPSNEGRGYVIRRILRRAARYGRMLNMHQPFLYKLVDTVGEILGTVYSEIIERKKHIRQVIKSEEQSFGETLDKGLEVYQQIKRKLQQQRKNKIPGAEVFRLYDTYGFPVDLTRLMAEEDGYSIDLEGFQQAMEKQKEQARLAQKFKMDQTIFNQNWTIVSEGTDSEFVGYDKAATKSVLRKYLIQEDKYHLVLDKTPFYAESGGEIGDTGMISNEDFVIEVTDTQKVDDMIMHIGILKSGKLGNNYKVDARIDVEYSDAIRLNHTATHLLHAALREVLGEHVHQSGSLVEAERLRFDFTHYTKVSQDEIEKVDDIVNRKIRENIEVVIQHKSFDDAKKSGAIALFGEKYGDIVRIIDVGDFSKELCGGKHIRRTGDIGVFKIVSESSVAAGTRRIEAITGQAVIDYIRKNNEIIDNITKQLSVNQENVIQKVTDLLTRVKQLEKDLRIENARSIADELTLLLNKAQVINRVTVFQHHYDVMNLNELKKIADLFREKVRLGVALLSAISEEKPIIVVTVTDQVIQKFKLNAGTIVRELGKILGGGGGGHPHLATAGGKNIKKIPEAIDNFNSIVTKSINQ